MHNDILYDSLISYVIALYVQGLVSSPQHLVIKCDMNLIEQRKYLSVSSLFWFDSEMQFAFLGSGLLCREGKKKASGL